MNDNIIIDLDHDTFRLLARMSEDTGRCPEELAASLLADVLRDDAKAHERCVVPDPFPLVEIPVSKMESAPPPANEVAPATKPSKLKAEPVLTTGAQAIVDKLPKLLKKTSAEIRREARNRDPILVEKEARELATNVPLPKASGPGRPKGAKTDKVVLPAPHAPVSPKVVLPSGTWTAGEDATIRALRALGTGPYDIAKTLKRDVNDVRKRIAELWVKK